MGSGLIKVFPKTNYCINPDTVEEIIPYEESENKAVSLENMIVIKKVDRLLGMLLGGAAGLMIAWLLSLYKIF